MTQTALSIAVSNLGKSYRQTEPAWSLRHVSFDLHKGETVGVVGPNGAGKSTLLKIIAGIVTPTEGQVRRRGRLFPLLELGCGFHPDFTGRQNLFTSGAILGLPRAAIAREADAIIAFADIGPAIDRPVKTYSSGMFARLAMALSLHIDADLLLIDEILSVGDLFFQRKCADRMQQRIGSGQTVLLCSHDLGAIRRTCSRVLYLDHGRLVADGPPDAVLATYLQSGRTPDAALPQASRYPVRAADEWQPDDPFQAAIKSPRGLALADNGNLLVAEFVNHAVYETDRTGSLIQRWGDTGFDRGQIYEPVGLDRLPDGGLAVADYGTGRMAVLFRDRPAEPLFERLSQDGWPFLVRFAPDGLAWISAAADHGLRIVGLDGTVRRAPEIEDKPRHITDITFRNGQAFLVDFQNDEILILDATTAALQQTVSLAAIDGARAPHTLGRYGDHWVITAHDSHTLLVLDPTGKTVRPVACIDLRRFLIQHPCDLLIDGDRAYISASLLGGVIALDLSGWPTEQPKSKQEATSVGANRS